MFVPVLLLLLSAPQGVRPASMETIRVAAGLSAPVYASAPAGDERLFVLEYAAGRIRVIERDTLLPVPFLDIGALVHDHQDHGLLGLAFHPDYAQNGFFYVQYVDTLLRPTIARYQVSGDPNVADPLSAAIVLQLLPITNHQGGALAFGPNDGYLYAGFGDGLAEDPGNNSQSGANLRGKVVRLDVDSATPFAVPPTNPFVGVPGTRDLIWARGLRNPFRFAFDRATGDLYIGDVGQSNREEINFQPAASAGGENYGWRLMEGSLCFNPATNCDPGGLTAPVHEYGHQAGGCAGSVTGGVVYRGDALPALRGTYLFGDFCMGRFWSFRYDGATLSEFTERTAELVPRGGHSIDAPAAIVEDGLGELVIVDMDGEIYRIVTSLHTKRRKL
jgi:glucose/arabinose dehydrogenase